MTYNYMHILFNVPMVIILRLTLKNIAIECKDESGTFDLITFEFFPADNFTCINKYLAFLNLKIGWKYTDGKLHCLCTHLSAFGGNILVSPNLIDFDKV